MASVILKTDAEIQIILENGKVLARILSELISMAKPGVTTLELEYRANELLLQYGVKSSFKGYEGYPYGLVACTNDEVVHGMPSDRELADGDILTLDYGVLNRGFHSDMARTVVVGNSVAYKDEFLRVGRMALDLAVDACVLGNRLGDIGYAIQSTVEKYGYSVIRSFVGHGVGRELHEEPQVYGVGIPGKGMLLQEGMVLAVEVMYAMGSYEVEILEDGWTAVTADGSLSGMFENTVAITKSGPLVLTPLV